MAVASAHENQIQIALSRKKVCIVKYSTDLQTCSAFSSSRVGDKDLELLRGWGKYDTLTFLYFILISKNSMEQKSKDSRMGIATYRKSSSVCFYASHIFVFVSE